MRDTGNWGLRDLRSPTCMSPHLPEALSGFSCVSYPCDSWQLCCHSNQACWAMFKNLLPWRGTLSPFRGEQRGYYSPQNRLCFRDCQAGRVWEKSWSRSLAEETRHGSVDGAGSPQLTRPEEEPSRALVLSWCSHCFLATSTFTSPPSKFLLLLPLSLCLQDDPAKLDNCK